MGQETEDAQAIVEGDHHSPVPSPLLSVHLGFEAPSGRVASSVDPEGHREFLPGLSGGRSPDVKVEAVLAEFGISVEEELRSVTTGSMGDLPGRMAPGIGHFDPFPGNDRLRFLPAEIPDGRCGERYAFINCHAGSPGLYSLDPAAIDI